MKGFAAVLTVSIICLVSRPVQGTEFYGSLGPRYIVSSSPNVGDHWGFGGSLGLGLHSAPWGAVSFEGDFGVPVSSGAETSSANEWDISWVSASGSYQSPGKIFAKVNMGYLNYWVNIQKDPGSDSIQGGGFTFGGGIGWRASEKVSVTLDVWPMASVSLNGEEAGYIYKIGASAVVRF